MREILIITLVIAIFAASVAAKTDSNQIPDITGHNLKVVLYPEEKKIEAEDMVTLNVSPPDGEFSFTLNKNLSITSLMSGSIPVKYEVEPYEGPDVGETSFTEIFATVKIKLPGGADSFTIKYEGEIYDPIEPSTSLGRGRSVFTSGIISEKGVYLCSRSGWYPDTYEAMTTFRIEVHIPKDWYAVCQGDLIERNDTDDGRMSIWGSDIVFGGCVLVANAYKVRTRNIDGVDCSTYFYNDNPELSDSFLDKLEEYIPAYQELFGPYQYSRFDVVENFFSTGYGMPGYTLLGSRVLTMPFSTREGSLAHELVHCWWGNYVIPDWDKGNWCEALTYYSTNYYWNILNGDPDAAEEFRATDFLKYSLQVGEDDEYPVRKFLFKYSAIDGNIGYSKGGAIFGMVHRMLGDEAFFKSLRLVIDRHGGLKATWDDFRDAFEDVSGRDLKGFFSSWLDNKGNPKLKIENLRQEEKYGNYRVTARITQEGEKFYMMLPILIRTENGEVHRTIELGPEPYTFQITLDEKAVSIELDPDMFIFRNLTPEEIRPCLNATMDTDRLLVVLPSGGENDLLEVMDFSGMIPGKKKKSVKDVYKELAESITDSGTKATIKYDNEVTETDLRESGVLCLGATRYNSLTSKLAGDVGDVFIPEDNSFTIDGEKYDAEGMAVLITIRNPYNNTNNITFYLGNSPQAVFKASYIFFYTLYSYVIYDNGAANIRHNWEREKGPLYREF